MSMRNKAEEYRREAAACLHVAEKMSLSPDCARMLEMAQHWARPRLKAEKAAERDELL
jgi:hypothetical protein